MCLSFEGCAELGLSTWTAQKHDHHLRYSKRQKSAKVLFHQREAKIDAGRYSRGSEATAIADIDWVGINGYARVVFRKFACPIPMGGCATSVEKTGLCQDKRAGTDRTEPSTAGALQSEPVQKSRFVVQFARAHASRNEERIDRSLILLECTIRMHGCAEMI